MPQEISIALCDLQCINKPSIREAHPEQTFNGLQRLSDLLAQAQGRVVSATDRSIVCLFSDANAALKSSIHAQHELSSIPDRLRIVLHSSIFVSEEDTQMLHEPVQFMGQVLTIAQNKQIIITEPLCHRLNPDLVRDVTPVEATLIALDEKIIPLYAVNWQQEQATLLNAPHQQITVEPVAGQLVLRWREQKVALDGTRPCLSLGRGVDADLTIESEYASRQHARIEFHRNNFMLIDNSSNGTYVRINEDKEFSLHHEETVLRDKGVISLGRNICSKGAKLIYFSHC